MEKTSGRHRKPVRGWAQRVRWLLGAVLAALLCSSVDVRRQYRRPLPSPRRSALEFGKPVPGGRAAVADVGRPRPGQAAVVGSQRKPVPGLARVPRPHRPHPSEQGWCVDDDGVRGVRPYLFHHPGETPERKEPVVVVKGLGEFDELASAVRVWLDTHRGAARSPLGGVGCWQGPSNAKCMGHSSSRAAMAYLHARDERAQELADRLGERAAEELRRARASHGESPPSAGAPVRASGT